MDSTEQVIIELLGIYDKDQLMTSPIIACTLQSFKLSNKRLKSMIISITNYEALQKDVFSALSSISSKVDNIVFNTLPTTFCNVVPVVFDPWKSFDCCDLLTYEGTKKYIDTIYLLNKANSQHLILNSVLDSIEETYLLALIEKLGSYFKKIECLILNIRDYTYTPSSSACSHNILSDKLFVKITKSFGPNIKQLKFAFYFSMEALSRMKV